MKGRARCNFVRMMRGVVVVEKGVCVCVQNAAYWFRSVRLG